MSYERQVRYAITSGYVRMFRAYATLFGTGFDEVFAANALREMEETFGPYFPDRYERGPFSIAAMCEADLQYRSLPDLFMVEHLESVAFCNPDPWEGLCE